MQELPPLTALTLRILSCDYAEDPDKWGRLTMSPEDGDMARRT